MAKVKRADLKKAAEELNEILGLEPTIDIKAPDFEIEENLIEAASLIEEDDEISDFTMKILEQIGAFSEIEEEEEESEEEEYEPEEEIQEEELEEETIEEVPESKPKKKEKPRELKKKQSKSKNRTKEMVKLILRLMTDGVDRKEITREVDKKFPGYKESTIATAISMAKLFKEIENEGY